MRYFRKIWTFNDVNSDSQTNRKRSCIDKHLCLWSWQYRHFFLFERKTQICRRLMINRLMHRTHIKFDNSICENALRSCIDVENDERTLRNVMIKISKYETQTYRRKITCAKQMIQQQWKNYSQDKKIEKRWMRRKISSLIIFTCESLFTFFRSKSLQNFTTN
jgi:arylamine N-acetyltransferase